MLPTIWPGDVLVIERARGEEVTEGDIVLFCRDRRFVVHRVLAKDESADGQVVTQGDALPSPDPVVAGSDLRGKVSFILRGGRCIEPRNNLRISERAVAALVQRSEVAARIMVGIHGMCQTSQNKIPNDRAVPCQP